MREPCVAGLKEINQKLGGGEESEAEGLGKG